MKLTFALAALAGFAVATPNVFKRDTNCDLDAPKVPADNDCQELIDGLEERDEKEELDGGKPAVLACSDSCKVSVTPKEDGAQIMNEDLQGGANSVLKECSKGGDDFAGEVSGGGFTTSLEKGGDC